MVPDGHKCVLCAFLCWFEDYASLVYGLFSWHIHRGAFRYADWQFNSLSSAYKLKLSPRSTKSSCGGPQQREFSVFSASEHLLQDHPELKPQSRTGFMLLCVNLSQEAKMRNWFRNRTQMRYGFTAQHSHCYTSDSGAGSEVPVLCPIECSSFQHHPFKRFH